MTTYDDDELAWSGTIQRWCEQARLANDHVYDAVAEARKGGMSWTKIGYALGTSGQAAWERYGLTQQQKDDLAKVAADRFHQRELQGMEQLVPEPAKKKRQRR